VTEPDAIIPTMRHISLLCIFMGLIACSTATTFSGKAKVPKGPAGCQAICSKWSMEMAGMVAMGEYSTACICMVPGKAEQSVLIGGVGPAVVGVINQMRMAAEQEQRRGNSSSGSHSSSSSH
jgi:hypothetical protein